MATGLDGEGGGRSDRDGQRRKKDGERRDDKQPGQHGQKSGRGQMSGRWWRLKDKRIKIITLNSINFMFPAQSRPSSAIACRRPHSLSLVADSLSCTEL
jgi:hypothetical protein